MTSSKAAQTVAYGAGVATLLMLVAPYVLREELLFVSPFRLIWIGVFLATSLTCLAASVLAVRWAGPQVRLLAMLVAGGLATAVSVYGLTIGYGSVGAGVTFEGILPLAAQLSLAIAIVLGLSNRVGLIRA